MHLFLRLLGCLLLPLLCLNCRSAAAPQRPVVLDIGHHIGDGGASSPKSYQGKAMDEVSFWYRYCYDIKRVVEAAGYPCLVCNRGEAPTRPPLADDARRAGVIQLRQKQKSGRYASELHPDRYAAGQVSADFAIRRQALCVVFLHHNGTSSRLVEGPSPSMILHNRYNGKPLADALCRALNTEVLNHGLDNGGKPCEPAVRFRAADPSAGWMNALDDSGIPAAVTEVTDLSNRRHLDYLSDDAQARRFAESIGRGIVDFLHSYDPQQAHMRLDDSKPDEGSNGKTIRY